MAFGSFREVVVIEQAVETTNEVGEFIQEWRHFAKARAQIRSVTYNQQAMMDQQVPTASWDCRIRWIDGVRGKMRVRWQSNCNRILNISSMQEIGHRQYLRLTLEERPEA